MEDKLLIFRCKRGSTDAVRRIYEKYRDKLLILAIALLNDVNSAEDVVHDTFCAFVDKIDGFKLTGSLYGFLATCVANRARNQIRARQKVAVSTDNLDLAGPASNDPAGQIVAGEQLQQLSDALSSLPFEQREVIILHLHSRMSLAAVARSQDISINTVKSRYRYGINKLRSLLNHEAEK